MVHGSVSVRDLVLFDWERRLLFDRYDHVYKPVRFEEAFRNLSVEDATVVLNSVDAIEHQSMEPRCKRTVFLDPYRKVYRVQETEDIGPDGVKGTLVTTR